MVVEFIPNQGNKLSSGGRSLLFTNWLLLKEGARLTDRQIKMIAAASSEFLDGINERSKLRYKRTQITPAQAQPLADDAPAYKFTTDEALPFWLNGSIRLNPVAFYQTIENDKARDMREGMGFIYLRSAGRHATFGLMSGFNSYAICASADARMSERKDRHSRFGPRLIRINRANEFAEKIARLAGARRHVVRDVTYSDTKIVKADSDIPDAILKVDATRELTDKVLTHLADNHIDELIELGEAATVFTKPASYWIERERRFLFAMDTDVASWTSVQDSELASHIELLV